MNFDIIKKYFSDDDGYMEIPFLRLFNNVNISDSWITSFIQYDDIINIYFIEDWNILENICSQLVNYNISFELSHPLLKYVFFTDKEFYYNDYIDISTSYIENIRYKIYNSMHIDNINTYNIMDII